MTNEIDIFSELDEERAERLRAWREIALIALRKEVPIEIEIEETIKDNDFYRKEARIAEEALERVAEKLKEKEGEESEIVQIIEQCAWWIRGQRLRLSATNGTLKRALEELRRRQK